MHSAYYCAPVPSIPPFPHSLILSFPDQQPVQVPPSKPRGRSQLKKRPLPTTPGQTTPTQASPHHTLAPRPQPHPQATPTQHQNHTHTNQSHAPQDQQLPGFHPNLIKPLVSFAIFRQFSPTSLLLFLLSSKKPCSRTWVTVGTTCYDRPPRTHCSHSLSGDYHVTPSFDHVIYTRFLAYAVTAARSSTSRSVRKAAPSL